MRSRSRLVLASGPRGATSIVDVRSEAPIVVRRAGGRILLGASAAGPLGGDEIELDVLVQAGCRAEIGTVGAMLLLPGPVGDVARRPSSIRTTITVEAGAELDWLPEPAIAAAGCDHRSSFDIRLADDARLRFVDELSLGRSGERSGRCRTTLRVERGGRVVLHHDESYGAVGDDVVLDTVAAAPAIGHVSTRLTVGLESGERAVEVRDARSMFAVMPLADDVVLSLGVGPDRPTVSALAARARSRSDRRGSSSPSSTETLV